VSDRGAAALAAPDTRVVLMGMMGTGKTTVGRLLAIRLGIPYLDNDEAVRALSGREPAEIRDTDGEEALHRLESAALAWALGGPPPMIVGAAGAIAEDPRAAQLVARDTIAVWLRATPETLLARIGGGEGRRVEATDLDWMTRRATVRAQAYAALADLIIDVDTRTPQEVADAIAASLERPADAG
jgi:shikimate kinase